MVVLDVTLVRQQKIHIVNSTPNPLMNIDKLRLHMEKKTAMSQTSLSIRWFLCNQMQTHRSQLLWWVHSSHHNVPAKVFLNVAQLECMALYHQCWVQGLSSMQSQRVLWIWIHLCHTASYGCSEDWWNMIASHWRMSANHHYTETLTWMTHFPYSKCCRWMWRKYPCLNPWLLPIWPRDSRKPSRCRDCLVSTRLHPLHYLASAGWWALQYQ